MEDDVIDYQEMELKKLETEQLLEEIVREVQCGGINYLQRFNSFGEQEESKSNQMEREL